AKYEGEVEMKEFIIAIVTLLGGFFLGKQQERWKSKIEIERKKKKLFCLIRDLESRRVKDLQSINSAFCSAILEEVSLINQGQFKLLSLPTKIEGKPIEDTFNSVIEDFEIGYRDGVRALLANIEAVNKQLVFIGEKFNSQIKLTSSDLNEIHGQIIIYSYLVHELNIKKERYIHNGMSNQEVLEVAAKAFDINYHIDDIVAEKLKHITKR
ncbi:TPA: hypothetical protein ACGU2S_004574, partial [Vibrio vulnificus]